MLCEKMTQMCTYFKTKTDVAQNLIYKTLLIPLLPQNFSIAVLTTTTWRLIFTEIKLESEYLREGFPIKSVQKVLSINIKNYFTKQRWEKFRYVLKSILYTSTITDELWSLFWTLPTSMMEFSAKIVNMIVITWSNA